VTLNAVESYITVEAVARDGGEPDSVGLRLVDPEGGDQYLCRRNRRVLRWSGSRGALKRPGSGDCSGVPWVPWSRLVGPHAAVTG
jgi:hypothetical protein